MTDVILHEWSSCAFSKAMKSTQFATNFQKAGIKPSLSMVTEVNASLESTIIVTRLYRPICLID